MDLLFTFSDGTTSTSEFILDGANLTQCYYNELKSADNSARIKIPFNETLSDKLKTQISKNVKVQIREDATTNIFTGYLRKTLSFQKTQRNQPISLEIVSPALLLDYDYNGNDIQYTETTLANVVSALLSLSPFSGSIDVSPIETKQILIFKLSNGNNIKTLITELLFEYGYCFDFDEDGNFYTTQLFKTVPTTISQKFNGDNCLNSIDQTVKEDKYQRVSVEWNKVEYKSDVVIFEDTTGADSTNTANITIDANSYYLGEEINYLQYDSKFQDILWITSAAKTINYDSTSGITEIFNNLGNQGELSIYNSGNSARTITELKVKGNGYFEISTNFVKTGSSSGKEYSYKAKYIQNSEDASYIAKRLCDYYNYSNFLVTVISKSDYEVGSFVELSDEGIGTLTCRIVKKIWDIKLNRYTYTIESITEYTPVETYTKSQKVPSNSDNGDTLRSSISDLNTKVDSIVTSATMVSADILSAIIKLDNDGKTITAQDITTTIKLKQSDVDLEFSIGSINLPDGWSYSINGNQVVFHIQEGVSLRSGQFAIPVLYKTVLSEDFYVDDNGEQYVDEYGIPYVNQVMSGSYTQWNLYFTYFGDNGGVYLGTFTQLTQIPSSNNYGDYFTWGANDTTSSLSYDGKFLRARVYKYVGENKAYKWIQDENAGHGQVALSDVLAVANEDLSKNNSTVYMFLDHLTSNTIYSDMIVSNNAFINKITNKIISVGELATVGYVSEETAKSEMNALNDTLEELGIDTLSNHTIIKDGKIKTDLINASAIIIGSSNLDESLTNTIDGKADSKDIPTKTSDLTNDSSFATTSDIPTNTSDLTNDSEYTTKTYADGIGTTAETNRQALITALSKDASKGHTVIDGGYLKTDLIDANEVWANIVTAKQGNFENINITGDVHAYDLKITCSAGDIILREFRNIVAPDYLCSQIIATGSVRIYIKISCEYAAALGVTIYKNNDIYYNYITPYYSAHEFTLDIPINTGDYIKVVPNSEHRLPATTVDIFRIMTNKSNSILAYLGDWNLVNEEPSPIR